MMQSMLLCSRVEMERCFSCTSVFIYFVRCVNIFFLGEGGVKWVVLGIILCQIILLSVFEKSRCTPGQSNLTKATVSFVP